MKLHFANAIESLTKHFQVNSLSGQVCRANTILKFQFLIPSANSTLMVEAIVDLISFNC